MLSLTEIRQFFHGAIRIGEPLAPYCTLGVGGPADYLLEVSSRQELVELTEYFVQSRFPHVVVQPAMLVSDKGFRGAAICDTRSGNFTDKSITMFKTPENGSVATLIQAARVNGILWGGAEIVGNSVANVNGATASDIYALVHHAQRIIRDTCGVHLEVDFELIGFDQEQLARVA